MFITFGILRIFLSLPFALKTFSYLVTYLESRKLGDTLESWSLGSRVSFSIDGILKRSEGELAIGPSVKSPKKVVQ